VRIGFGYDAHRFGAAVKGHAISLGGVQIPHDREVVAHSDGDVMIHALCDALLGALALGDIGMHFPDSDPRYRGVDSRQLLRACYQKVQQQGLTLGNADITLIAERPRIGLYRDRMRAALAADMASVVDRVSVKATTTEKMGFVGREEGLAAEAVVLLV
jgi:2-C-methyl-D-erythritol 2,4-cyclodiphosphate synthase